jgi:hypothetical protein
VHELQQGWGEGASLPERNIHSEQRIKKKEQRIFGPNLGVQNTLPHCTHSQVPEIKNKRYYNVVRFIWVQNLDSPF